MQHLKRPSPLADFRAMAFTPIESGMGGLLIGLSAALAYQGDGKITGIGGSAEPFLHRVGKCQPMTDGQLWKALFWSGCSAVVF